MIKRIDEILDEIDHIPELTPAAAAVMYSGLRTESGGRVCRHDGAKVTLLNPLTHLRNHSPSGLEWGYGGSGPAQLAFALAVDVAGVKAGSAVYQRLKWFLVARLPLTRWLISASRVHQAIKYLVDNRPDDAKRECDTIIACCLPIGSRGHD